jgi:hypothetical protein
LGAGFGTLEVKGKAMEVSALMELTGVVEEELEEDDEGIFKSSARESVENSIDF